MAQTSEPSYYEILGVSKDVDAKSLKRAWHALSKKYHPDKAPEDKKASLEEKMKEINEAYGVLSDSNKRKIYDRFGKKGLQQGADDDFQQRRNDLVQPIQVPLHLSLKELYSGKTISVTFPRKTFCKSCDMTGTKNKIRNDCQDCKGKGHKIGHIRRGPFIQQGLIECDKCKGTGLRPGTIVCDFCKGSKVKDESFTLSQTITPGMCHGDVIEIPNEGHEIPSELQVHTTDIRGSVLLVVQEQDHTFFKRTNTGESDLAIEIQLSLAEALCGFTRSIEHLDGRKLSIVDFGGISHGDIKVIKHEGMPSKLNPIMRGNLLVKFSVKIPLDLDKRAIYECLTGKSLDEVDFSTPPDHVMTNLCSLSEVDVERDEPQQQNCCVQ